MSHVPETSAEAALAAYKIAALEEHSEPAVLRASEFRDARAAVDAALWARADQESRASVPLRYETVRVAVAHSVHGTFVEGESVAFPEGYPHHLTAVVTITSDLPISDGAFGGIEARVRSEVEDLADEADAYIAEWVWIVEDN